MKKPFAKKSFGQNFLVDQNYVQKIINSLSLQKGETIIEIGAGRGALTEKLIESGAQVIAIELDRDLIPDLSEKFGKRENFVLIEQDALRVDFRKLISNNHQTPFVELNSAKLVANLPYYISTAILQKLIEQRGIFSEMTLMFQREVVERVTAEIGKKERGFLSVLVQMFLQTEKLFDVPPNAFSPAPKVQSSVMRLITKAANEIDIGDEVLFREIISLSFSQKRKTIQNNLKNAGFGLSEAIEKIGGLEFIFAETKIESSRRAESLSIEEWRRLTNFVAEKGINL